MRRNDLELYNTYAPEWWSEDQSFLRLLKRLVPARLSAFSDVAPSWEGIETLDLGCGGGFMAEALARRGARVIGVDPAEAALNTARAHAQAMGLRIDYRLGVGEAIPLEDASVDRVVAVDMLEHVADLEAVIGEIRRVLRPGGLLLFDTINRNWFARLVMITLAEDLLGLIPRGLHDPAKFIKPRELLALLDRNGLKGGGITGLGPVALDRRLGPVFGRIPFKAVAYFGHAVRQA